MPDEWGKQSWERTPKKKAFENCEYDQTKWLKQIIENKRNTGSGHSAKQLENRWMRIVHYLKAYKMRLLDWKDIIFIKRDIIFIHFTVVFTSGDLVFGVEI